jgi:hypothetical protein
MRFLEYVIILHLSTLKYSLLKIHKLLRRLRSYWSNSASQGDLIIQNIFTSSAKSSKREFVTFISFTYILNKKGAR